MEKYDKNNSNRYTIILFIIIIAFSAILLRLARLTIAEGDYYRELADKTRVREVAVKSARGEIRDRYGRLLAGNKSSFTVQIMKDELDKKQINKTMLNLYKLLESQTENFIDEFPIMLNDLEFTDKEAYFKKHYEALKNSGAEDVKLDASELSVYEEISQLVSKHNLLGPLMDSFFQNETANGNYTFIATQVFVNSLREEYGTMPVKVALVGQEVKVEIYDKEKYHQWALKNALNENTEPKILVRELIMKNPKSIESSLENPLMRKFVYEILEAKGLNSEFEMQKFKFVYDTQFNDIKAKLISEYPEITMKTTAEEDFYTLVKTECLYDMLSKPIETLENRTFRQVLLEELNKVEKTPLAIDQDINENQILVYNEKEKNAFLDKWNLNKEVAADDALLMVSDKKGVLKTLILSEEIKFVSQGIMLEKSINPRISLAKMEYTSVIEKNDFVKKYKLEPTNSAEEVFEQIRSEKYLKIDENLSDYEARLIMTGNDQVNKVGYQSYQPVNIAYNVTEKTVSKLMENKIEMPAVKVNIEPIREYPMEQTSAHIIGYLGKISSKAELENYIAKGGNKNYSPNDIVGKTGVEESFESYLKGQDGKKKVEVDIRSVITSTVSEEPAVPGNNLFLSIDTELQKTAEDALARTLKAIQTNGVYESPWGNYSFGNAREHFKNAKSGAMVAIDVKTGKVLAMASYPSYDPNLFATGITAKDWKSLMPENEKDIMAPRPLYNIAMQTAIQPGSTFKMITALAGLEKGINPLQKIQSMGYIEYGNARFGCWIWNNSHGMHGPTDMYDALRVSCNYYFYTLVLGENLRTGQKLGTKVTIYDIMKVATEFGLNDKTGVEINIPNEKFGGVPNPVTKALYSKRAIVNFLNNNLEFYLKSDAPMSNKDKEKIVNEVASWAELEKTPSYNQVYTSLSALGFDPQKSNGRERSLADTLRYSYLYDAGWKTANTLNVSIGQGENSYTPIQMANFIAALAADGERHKVSVVQDVRNHTNDQTVFEPKDEIHQVDLKSDSYYDVVKTGMNEVMTSGTARNVFKGFPIGVAAKTGTAQKDGISPITGKGYDDYAWFVAYAPYKDPQIAVATVIFQGGHGGSAGPPTRDVIAQYLGLNYTEKTVDYSSSIVNK